MEAKEWIATMKPTKNQLLQPEVDYRKFRLNKLDSPAFSHIKLLLYWPFFGVLFLFLERLQPERSYYAVHCVLDDFIPFCEWSLIPYLFWFAFLIGTLVYCFFCDIRAFRRMMYFVMVTYSITMIIYILFPTCQNLRPTSFSHNNLLIWIVQRFYAFDTNTNVFPSLHVVGSFSAMFAIWDSKKLQRRSWKIFAAVATFSISLSTVFMKQHSILDVAGALPICALGWQLCYKKRPNRQKRFLQKKANISV